MNSEIVLEAHQLRKSYHKDQIEVPVLRGVDLQVRRGLVTTLVGRSGSGKSTLMHLLAALDHPDQGEIFFGGEPIHNANRKRRDAYRNKNLGIIFQFYHLLPELSAIENVLAPLMISQSVLTYFNHRKSAKRRAEEMLDRVGLLHRASHKPSEMSGGEMQRAAIARALMTKPSLLLADEPTGNLDTDTGREILQLLKDFNRDDGLSILMITHDDTIAENADDRYRMQDGKLITDSTKLHVA
ncbi:MAG: ABC transporter ATP-binding protein [Rubripirellula sp.]